MGPLRVVCGIIEHQGRILLARRAGGQALAGHWELPGGKIEPGETAPEALRRELAEELCIETEILDRVGETQAEWKDRGLVLEAWLVRISRGTPQTTVHDRLEWTFPDQALGYLLAPADIPLIKNFLYTRENQT